MEKTYKNIDRQMRGEFLTLSLGIKNNKFSSIYGWGGRIFFFLVCCQYKIIPILGYRNKLSFSISPIEQAVNRKWNSSKQNRFIKNCYKTLKFAKKILHKMKELLQIYGTFLIFHDIHMSEMIFCYGTSVKWSQNRYTVNTILSLVLSGMSFNLLSILVR